MADDHRGLAAVLPEPVQHLPVHRASGSVQGLATEGDARCAVLPGDLVPALCRAGGWAGHSVQRAVAEAVQCPGSEGPGFPGVVHETVIREVSQGPVCGGTRWRGRADKLTDGLSGPDVTPLQVRLGSPL